MEINDSLQLYCINIEYGGQLNYYTKERQIACLLVVNWIGYVRDDRSKQTNG